MPVQETLVVLYSSMTKRKTKRGSKAYLSTFYLGGFFRFYAIGIVSFGPSECGFDSEEYFALSGNQLLSMAYHGVDI